MILDEFLIKLGVISDTKKLDEFKAGLGAIASTATAVVGVVGGLTAGITAFFGSALSGLDDLANLAADTDTDLAFLQKFGYAASMTGASVEAANASIKGFSLKMGEAISGMGEGAKLFSSLGISVKNADGSVRSVADAMSDVSARMQGLSRSEQLNMLNKLGIDQGMIGLLSSTSSEMAELFNEAEALGLITAHGADAAAEYNDALDQMKHVTGALRTNIAIGLAPQLTLLMSGMKEWLIQNKELVQNGINKLVDWVLAIGKAIINFIRAINQVIESTIGWKNALLILVGVLAYLKRATIAAFAVNPVFWIVAAIAGLIVLVDDLFTFLNGGQSAFDWSWALPILEKFKPIIEKLSDAFNKFFDMVGKLAKIVFGYLAKFFSENKETILSGLMYLIDTVSNFVSFISNLIGMLISLLTGDWDSFFSYLDSAWEDAKDTVKSVINAFKESFKVFLALFGIDADKMYKKFDSVCESISNVWTAITDAISNAFTSTINFITDIWNGFKNAVSVSLNFISNLFDVVMSTISNIFSALVSLLTGDWGGFVKYLNSALDGILKYFDTIFSAVWQLIKGFLDLIGVDIDSLIAVFDTTINSIKNIWTSGLNFISSLMKSIVKTISKTWSDFSDHVIKIVDGLSSIFNSWSNLVSTIFSAVIALFTGDWDGFVKHINSALDGILKYFDTVFSAVWQLIKGFLDLIGVDTDGFVAAFQTAVNTVKTAWDNVTGALKTAWDKTMGVIMAGVDKVKGALDWIGEKLGITSSEIDEVNNKAQQIGTNEAFNSAISQGISVATSASAMTAKNAVPSMNSNSTANTKNEYSNNAQVNTTINIQGDNPLALGKKVEDVMARQNKQATLNGMGPMKL